MVQSDANNKSGDDTPVRCEWADYSPLMRDYHDTEWGVPVHDDRLLFEFLILEGAQAGLSWSTILAKREAYRDAFDRFEPGTVASYDDKKIECLKNNSGIVRNRLKIAAAVTNARAYLDVAASFGSFDAYLWRFSEGRTIHNQWRNLGDIPAHTPLSHKLSHDLKQRGFSFVGPTICYAFMQAIGMVNDHTRICFRHDELIW